MSSWVVRASNNWAWVCVVHGDLFVTVGVFVVINQSSTVLLIVSLSLLLSIRVKSSCCLCVGHI